MNKIKNCDVMFFSKVGLQHPNFRKWTLPRAFSLESLRSTFHGFSKIAIIYGILTNN